jgi:poly-gamma-glutamate capsule biosynthesis protein CapA/YwtB (metallophosphatase superfamily)
VPGARRSRLEVAGVMDGDRETACASPSGAKPAPGGRLALFLAGDLLIARPWSEDGDPAFLGLVRQIRAADVAIGNLETVIHERRGYAQADSGGTYAAAPPQVARDLAWAGFTMVAHANNHAFDFGSIGVLETLDHVRQAGLGLAGSGEDLQRARAPAFCRHPQGTVALVAAASTLIPYGRASHTFPDFRGRPGVNPLRVDRGPLVCLTRATATRLAQVARTVGFSGLRFALNRFSVGPVELRVGNAHGLHVRARIDEADLAANLAAIHEAARVANVVVVSLHDHGQGRCLRNFARRAIEAGASVVLAHGPHEVRGLELHDGKPIFYSLGNFVFEPEHIEHLPSDFYERYGLPADATKRDRERIAAHLASRPETWQGVAARLRFAEGVLAELTLIPVDLGLGRPAGERGRPRLADAVLGRQIIERMARKSRASGTEISYAAADNTGLVKLL